MVKLLELITKHYTEPHRRYHTLEHIGFMFEIARERHIPLTRAQTLAIWFHDVIYDPTRNDNEEKSRQFAHDHMNHLQDVDFLDVLMMIMDTKTHEPRSAMSAVVCDLDMAILATSRNFYLRYTQNIRAEYAHVPDKEFYEARNDFLIKLVMKKQIFHTNYFLDFEQVARHNVQQEIVYNQLIIAGVKDGTNN